jgi:hypothetical protein
LAAMLQVITFNSSTSNGIVAAKINGWQGLHRFNCFWSLLPIMNSLQICFHISTKSLLRWNPVPVFFNIRSIYNQ